VKIPIFLSAAKALFLAEPKTRAQDIPETPPPIIKTSNMSYLSFVFSSIIFDILKIRRMKMAQNEAAIPINPTTLSPSNK
jgi:hypothetical protein